MAKFLTQKRYLTQLFALLLCTCTAWSAVVPKIEQENFQLIPDGEHKYHLIINLPTGSVRDETVELLNADTPEEQLFVKGSLETAYTDVAYRLVVTYEAGVNGYVAKYRLEAVPQISFALAPQTLKSAAG